MTLRKICIFVLVFALPLLGCGPGIVPGEDDAGGMIPTNETDAGALDGAVSDGGPLDGAVSDGGALDAAVADSGVPDAGIFPAFDVESYALVGAYDFVAQRLNAQLTVTLSPNAVPPVQLVLDSRVAKVNSVRLSGGAPLSFRIDPAAGTLSISLESAAQPGAQFVIDYSADRQLNGGVLTAALNSFDTRRGDPAEGRVAYTFSEPTSARAWLPSHDDPSDRALFSADFSVSEGERLISNGALVSDSRNGPAGAGRMKYATDYPIPTYLMAFAVGEFQVEQLQGPHGLPLSVWHRKGVFGDFQELLLKISGMVDHYEKLTQVQYPFEKYSLVLVPEFPGGEEHASITFQSETNSNEALKLADISLTAHELGHQWFGDLVTVETWNDLWLKEGMATVMEWEGSRPLLDNRDARGIDGEPRFVRSGQAIRDVSVAPDDKYNSGPYNRAAWLLSQIRQVVGEEKFWGTWKTLLNSNRFGTLSTERFLSAFRGVLTDEALAKVRKAIDAKGIPALTLSAQPNGATRLSLVDVDGSMIVPIEFQWIRSNGTLENLTLAPGAAVDLLRNAPDDLLVIDPTDVHPTLRQFVPRANRSLYYERISELLVPVSEAQRKRFLELKAAHQNTALYEGTLTLESTEFTGFYEGLDSDAGRILALSAACRLAENSSAVWKPLLLGLVQNPQFLSNIESEPDLESCAKLFTPDEVASSVWSSMRQGLLIPLIDERYVEYLSRFSTNAQDMLAVWSAVAERSYSLRIRRTAAITLASFASTPNAIPAAERPSWRTMAARLAASSEVPRVVSSSISLLRFTAADTAEENAAGRMALSQIIQTPGLLSTHKSAACAAYQLCNGDKPAFMAFVDGLKNVSVAPSTTQVLADPVAACGF
jgi:aminopeptidase N